MWRLLGAVLGAIVSFARYGGLGLVGWLVGFWVVYRLFAWVEIKWATPMMQADRSTYVARIDLLDGIHLVVISLGLLGVYYAG